MFIECSIENDLNEIIELNEVYAIRKRGGEDNYLIVFYVTHGKDSPVSWHYGNNKDARDSDYEELRSFVRTHKLGMDNLSEIK